LLATFDEHRTEPWKEGWIAADIQLGMLAERGSSGDALSLWRGRKDRRCQRLAACGSEGVEHEETASDHALALLESPLWG